MIKQKNKQANVLVSILGKWSPQDFIQTCWQKEPLLIAAAMPDIGGIIDRQDLMALACEAETESRLIVADSQQKNWHCEQGPFRQKHFKALPASHWTLLVQAVDQYRPALAELLTRFEFLPRWRLDDIMVSYATKGGGVGPHFDYYDVFLLQASGTRRWQLGQRCDEQSPLRDHPDMKLLKNFKQTAEHTLKTGDMLYIPAGVAHWGTALDDDCMTISIGFRAAAQRELIQMALHKIACDLPDSLRYRDSAQSIDADPFCINEHAIKNVQALWSSLSDENIKQTLAQALGEYATEVRYPERLEPAQSYTLSKLNKYLSKDKVLSIQHHSASRYAYRVLDKNRAELYVDGESYATRLKLAQAICHEKITAGMTLNDSDKTLLLTLINQGSLLLSSAYER